MHARQPWMRLWYFGVREAAKTREEDLPADAAEMIPLYVSGRELRSISCCWAAVQGSS